MDRDLDIRVAKEVFNKPDPTWYRVTWRGITVCDEYAEGGILGWPHYSSNPQDHIITPLPNYSKYIVDAMLVVDRVSLMNVLPNKNASHTIYGFGLERESQYVWKAAFGIHSAVARTAMEAICLAALRAMKDR